MVQQLKDLAELKDQGILTEEEFAAQKARILGG
jgi:Short C-terminal domain